MITKKSSTVYFLPIKERFLLWMLEYRINRHIRNFYVQGGSVCIDFSSNTSTVIREILMQRCREAGWTVVFNNCYQTQNTKQLRHCFEID